MIVSGRAKYTYSKMHSADGWSPGLGTTHIDLMPSCVILTISPTNTISSRVKRLTTPDWSRC